MPPEYEAFGYFQMLKDPTPEGKEFLRLQAMVWVKPLRGGVAQRVEKLRQALEMKLCMAADVAWQRSHPFSFH
jgi:hypothetical protein